MTLLQLKYIVKIVECGSMNEASHALYVSQPALSSSVKELENELGIEIFTRSSARRCTCLSRATTRWPPRRSSPWRT